MKPQKIMINQSNPKKKRAKLKPSYLQISSFITNYSIYSQLMLDKGAKNSIQRKDSAEKIRYLHTK